MKTGKLISYSVEETEQAAFRLAKELQPGDVVALWGELGSGKTVFTRGLARGLGVDEAVLSPSFALIHEYTGNIPVYHFDLYRLENPKELENISYEDYIARSGVCIIEWADKFEEMIPPGAVWVFLETMDMSENERRISFEAPVEVQA